jgi:hypothetical protein
MADLSASIKASDVECLNSSSDVLPVFQGKGAIKSDDDAQLIINISFPRPQKMTSIAFEGPPGMCDLANWLWVCSILMASPPPTACAPKAVQLFVNTPALAFDSIDAYTPAVELDLPTASVSMGTPSVLTAAPFQHVTSLSIFVQSNQSGLDQTIIQKIRILGPAAAGAAGAVWPSHAFFVCAWLTK